MTTEVVFDAAVYLVIMLAVYGALVLWTGASDGRDPERNENDE